MFSETLLAQLLIKDKFNEALDIMNRAVASGVGECLRRNPRAPWAYSVVHKQWGVLAKHSEFALWWRNT